MAKYIFIAYPIQIFASHVILTHAFHKLAERNLSCFVGW